MRKTRLYLDQGRGLVGERKRCCYKCDWLLVDIVLRRCLPALTDGYGRSLLEQLKGQAFQFCDPRTTTPMPPSALVSTLSQRKQSVMEMDLSGHNAANSTSERILCFCRSFLYSRIASNKIP